MIDIKAFYAHERSFMCLVINTVGSGEHPKATPKTLASFTKEYVLDCLRCACDLKQRRSDRGVVKRLHDKFRDTPTCEERQQADIEEFERFIHHACEDCGVIIS